MPQWERVNVINDLFSKLGEGISPVCDLLATAASIAVNTSYIGEKGHALVKVVSWG